MKCDPLFKKKFHICTPIKYLFDVGVQTKDAARFSRAWKRFFKGKSPHINKTLKKRFDAFLRKRENALSDERYCRRIKIRYLSKKVGYGVFATQNIPRYTLIGMYTGILKPDAEIAKENTSTFSFADFKSFSIDGEKAGNWTRFINHSVKNTNVLALEHYTKKGPYIFFVAGSKGIKKGEQLLYSYGETYWQEQDNPLIL